MEGLKTFDVNADYYSKKGDTVTLPREEYDLLVRSNNALMMIRFALFSGASLYHYGKTDELSFNTSDIERIARWLFPEEYMPRLIQLQAAEKATEGDE